MRAASEPWVKIDQQMPWSKRIMPLSDGAFRLYVTAICWCASNETDGFLPQPIAHKLSNKARAKELVGAGLFIEHGTDYEIKDYLEHQLSRRTIDLYRTARSSDGKRGAHIRFHVIKGRVDTDCELCTEESGAADA